MVRIFRSKMVETETPGWYVTAWSLVRPRWLDRLDAIGREDVPSFRVVRGGFWPCEDCGWPTRPFEVYMVHDSVWAEAVADDDNGRAHFFLCVECLEERLGRELRPDDFTDVLMNTEPGPCSMLLHLRRGAQDATQVLIDGGEEG